MAWNALVENREGENLTNAIESSDELGINPYGFVRLFVYRKIFRGYNKHDI
mgnify:CR=1 FL=1